MRNISKFIRIFFFFSLFILIVVNWNWVKGIFDYKTIYSEVYNSLKWKITQEKGKDLAIKVPEVELSEPKYEPKQTEKPDSVEIPKIGITAPLVLIESAANKDITAALKKGVVHYSQSVLLGEEGQTVILGHSAPSGWPKINYDWVFSRLNELVPGDEVIINYQNREYRYLMTKKYFLKPGQDIPGGDLTNSENMLILISCWPPGTNIKRIAVEAQLAI